MLEYRVCYLSAQMLPTEEGDGTEAFYPIMPMRLILQLPCRLACRLLSASNDGIYLQHQVSNFIKTDPASNLGIQAVITN